MTKRIRPAETQRRNQRAPNPSAPPHSPPDLAHHRLKCRVCSHPKRREIEQDFLRWRSPEKLARDYGFPDHSSIYRHVHATGLSARRRFSLRAALERILERSDETESSDFDVIRAAGAYARLDDQGRWQPPAQHNVIIFAGDSQQFGDHSINEVLKLQQQASGIQSPTRKNRK